MCNRTSRVEVALKLRKVTLLLHCFDIFQGCNSTTTLIYSVLTMFSGVRRNFSRGWFFEKFCRPFRSNDRCEDSYICLADFILFRKKS